MPKSRSSDERPHPPPPASSLGIRLLDPSRGCCGQALSSRTVKLGAAEGTLGFRQIPDF
ncbi:hypothetical protein QT971_22550 [Microcoleus sp. herbarium19]|uniref:hypothetical protein n=1 Tax=unclassified Microcoleus TaxID=2642155 RepID=UPI002FD22CD5